MKLREILKIAISYEMYIFVKMCLFGAIRRHANLFATIEEVSLFSDVLCGWLVNLKGNCNDLQLYSEMLRYWTNIQ